MPYRFRSRRASDDRLLWDPRVHQHLFREDCYFYLLRMSEPFAVRSAEGEGDLVTRLEPRFNEAQISSYSAHIVWGYHDLLVRVWLPRWKRDRLIRTLAASPTVEAVDEFQAQTVDYLWWNPVGNEVIRRFRRKAEKLAHQTLEQGELDDALVEELIRAGLLWNLEGRSEESIKFYLALSRVPGIERENEVQRIVSATKELADAAGVDHVVLYTGTGLASYMIKGVVQRYPDVLPAISRVLDSINENRLPLRPMTLLIANNAAPESDEVGTLFKEAHPLLDQLEEYLGPAYAGALDALDGEQRRSLSDLFGRYDDLIDTEFGDEFQGLLAARVSDDIDGLHRQLSFLAKLEHLLRQFFCTLWIRRGPNWIHEIREVAEQKDISPSKHPETDYGLVEILRVASGTVERGWISETELGDALGPHWRDHLGGIVDLRNDVSHGKLFLPARQQEVRAHWDEELERVFRAGEVYDKLIRQLRRAA